MARVEIFTYSLSPTQLLSPNTCKFNKLSAIVTFRNPQIVLGSFHSVSNADISSHTAVFVKIIAVRNFECSNIFSRDLKQINSNLMLPLINLQQRDFIYDSTSVKADIASKKGSF